MTQEEQILEAFSDFGLDITAEQAAQYTAYYNLLISWNQRMNLTAITEFQQVLRKHFLDSVSLAKVLDLSQTETLIDVGTGAGFPGVPLKILSPKLKITLVDSVDKRLRFLREVVDELGLQDVELIHGRAEELGRKESFRDGFDLCVSRAVANMSTLCEYCLPFVKTGGIFAAYKTGNNAGEILDSAQAIMELGGELEREEKIPIPRSSTAHRIFFIRKITPTPEKYPRKVGIPAKRPIVQKNDADFWTKPDDPDDSDEMNDE